MVLLAAFNGATQAQVEDILKKIVDCINRGNDHFILLAQRDKNEATLLELGFRPADVRRIVEEELTYEDYYRGPNPNGSSNVPHDCEVVICGNLERLLLEIKRWKFILSLVLLKTMMVLLPVVFLFMNQIVQSHTPSRNHEGA